MLDEIRRKCGIASSIKTYDKDITELINDCLYDMKTAGVPTDVIPDQIDDTDASTDGIDPRILNTIALYVRAYLGDDRSDTDKYLQMYHARVFKLSLLSSEKGAPVATTDTTTTGGT